MKIDKITTILKTYVNQQLDNMNSPILSLIKPIVIRIVDNNISKVNDVLELMKDTNDEIDIDNILSDMMSSLLNSKPFDFGIFHIGNGNIEISVLSQRIVITMNDIELLKSMFKDTNYEQIN